MSTPDLMANQTRDPEQALHLFVAEYNRELARGAALDLTPEGEKSPAEGVVDMFLAHWQVRPKSEVGMEQHAQYVWQQKAKASVTALVAAIGGKVPTENQDEVWEMVQTMMAGMGFENGGDTIAGLIR